MNQGIKSICRALFIAIVCSLSSPAFSSDDQWYQVELIVFEHLDKSGLQETWPLEPGRPNLSNAKELKTLEQLSKASTPVSGHRKQLEELLAAEKDVYNEDPVEEKQRPAVDQTSFLDNFILVKDENLQLKDAKERVQKQGSYRIIFHKGWKQKITSKKLAEKLRLVGGKVYTPTTSRQQPANSFGDEIAMEQDYLGSGLDMEATHEVDGTLLISKGRFLHIDADLVFTRPMKVLTPATGLEGSLTASSPKVSLANVHNRNQWQGETNARLQPFRLNQSVRMRSNEVQYIDHPLYGILVAIMPDEDNS